MTHYYGKDGIPVYEIIGKNGRARTPYAKEARALGLVPGVTSINGQLNKSYLTTWFINKTINLCLKDPYCGMGVSQEDWIERIKRKLKKDGERIADQGHDMHGALEKYYKTGKISTKYKEFIIPVIDLITEKWPHLARTDWIAEASFNYAGLFGGKVDLHYPGENGKNAIILDFKAKDSVDIIKFKTYSEHRQQLIAYAYGLKIPEAECGNIFVSALKPGILTIQMYEELEEYWNKFKILTQYWHLEHFKQQVEF